MCVEVQTLSFRKKIENPRMISHGLCGGLDIEKDSLGISVETGTWINDVELKFARRIEWERKRHYSRSNFSFARHNSGKCNRMANCAIYKKIQEIETNFTALRRKLIIWVLTEINV